ncbi:UV DNA damage repair endonuclease UvsE [Clostridium sp. D2Q-11]|uniref:UV DNA damage repair endonuclease UvsE n=2 Tax=Anaeromonas frigoriresistens TaxID=2683708 RepID=A0A942ZAU7_9FIRM|nr:UV DNA damage repair endonuclease UvsE [Anaeromonas frigoriresistens]
MHPGQYTVLDSNNRTVVDNAISELEYHGKFLDEITDDYTHKIVLHIGGIYGDKSKAIERFIENFNNLSNNVKNRLIIENDEKNYTIEDVLYISDIINIPVVFDNLHNQINGNYEINDILNKVYKTWDAKDGNPKSHYSQQAPYKRIGSHTKTIEPYSFLKYINNMSKDVDIMLEVKDKNISTEKLMTLMNNDINVLRNEWGKYKYNIMEKSYYDYKTISKYINSDSPELQKFIYMLDKSLNKEKSIGDEINTINHIWGYFKKDSTKEEREKLFNIVRDYKQKDIHISEVKKYLYELTVKYRQDYLLNSYYFNKIY